MGPDGSTVLGELLFVAGSWQKRSPASRRESRNPAQACATYPEQKLDNDTLVHQYLLPSVQLGFRIKSDVKTGARPAHPDGHVRQPAG
jgi:hypothetical protein